MKIASTTAPTMQRMLSKGFAMPVLSSYSAFLVADDGARNHWCAVRYYGSSSDRLAISGLPAPGTRAVTTLRHSFLVDLRDDIAVAGEQRFGRTHFGAKWQLAFRQAVGAVFLILFLAEVGFGAAGAERTFVHLTA